MKIGATRFIIYGEPMGKQRPKFSRHGNYITTYTPQNTINYENWVKTTYIQANGKHYGSNPIQIAIDIFYKIPKSFSKKKTDEAKRGIIIPVIKPDADNVLKIICDSLNNIAYDDDKQVAKAIITKHYAIEPRVEVVIDILDAKIDT